MLASEGRRVERHMQKTHQDPHVTFQDTSKARGWGATTDQDTYVTILSFALEGFIMSFFWPVVFDHQRRRDFILLYHFINTDTAVGT